MKKLLAWLRTNAAVIAATSVLAGAIAPPVGDAIDTISRVATALAAAERGD